MEFEEDPVERFSMQCLGMPARFLEWGDDWGGMIERAGKGLQGVVLFLCASSFVFACRSLNVRDPQ